MRDGLLVLVVAAFTSSCAAGHAISAPSSPISDSTPYTLTIEQTVGVGVNAGHAGLTVRVRAIGGAPVTALPVALTTSAGTLEPNVVITDGQGAAVTMLSAPAGRVHVVAAGGSLHAETDVAIQAPTTPVSFQDSSFVPPQLPPLFVSLSAFTTATAYYGECEPALTCSNILPLGVPIRFHAYVFPDTRVRSVHWDFGDGATSDVTVGEAYHQYEYASGGGWRTIGVTVTAVDGRIASNAIQIKLTPTP